MERRLALVVAIGVLLVDKNNKHAVVRQEPVGKQDKESVIMAFISYCWPLMISLCRSMSLLPVLELRAVIL